ncbi:hypothetical protein ACBI99_45175 [Nonomuraea sp. ATR24]|uniref:hypothetical protein n=1 Tax=Nonomuraea TaxID=83681 RepID=UPI001C5D14C0|nr:hypothetical protein [Nonomuraea ceibae]
MSRHQGPTCRLIVHLSGIDWSDDRERATAKLLAQPGVLAVEVDYAHHELPDLRNWLIKEATSREQDGEDP